jgi:5'-nucleotidase (lipoprotein e(P4) family)
MRNTLLALFTVASLACATAPAPAPVAAAVTAPPCNPGHSILNATLWVQHSAEYRAAAMQTYANARRALDAALAETANDKPAAIVLDLDETALDNTPFEARVIRAGKTYDSATWKQWTAEGGAPAIAGAAEFLQYAKSRGVTPFYVSNRDEDERTGTFANLQKLGFPVEPSTLLLRQNNVSDKTPRRDQVAASHRLLLLIGDDLNDFVNAREKTQEQRAQLIAETAGNWGTRWFILPNPMYGSWERALIGSGGEPCEQVQRKIEALHDK